MFVVWQPVLKTDREPPDAAARARVTARHYWDANLVVARAAQPVLTRDLSNFRGVTKLVTGPVLWDYIAVYPPGVRWGDEFPRPLRSSAPVADTIGALLGSEGALIGTDSALRGSAGAASR